MGGRLSLPRDSHDCTPIDLTEQSERRAAIVKAYADVGIPRRRRRSIIGALCLLAAITVYPFQPQRLMSSFTWFMVLAAVVTAVATLVSMEREEILSRLGQTQPGQINLSARFVSQIAMYVVLPVFAVIAHMFLAVGDTVFGWLDPLQRALQ